VNADLVGKVVNLASRTARLAQSTGLSASYPDDGGLFAAGAALSDEIANAYESCDYGRAMRTVMKLADRANEYVERVQPWKLAKQPERAQELRDVCSVALNLFRQIVLYASPVLPQLAAQTAELFGVPFASWDDAQKPLAGTPIAPFKHLLARVDPKAVQAMLEASKEPEAGGAAKPAAPPAKAAPKAAPGAGPASAGQAEPIAPICSFEDFTKVDLRVAQILSAETVEGSRKLLRLRVSLGSEERTIFAGIRSAYEPAALIGRLIVVVANLAPRQMKVGTSEGMALAAGDGAPDVFLLSPDSGAQPGQRIH
jgi:methionyl-tRNA synthetase